MANRFGRLHYERREPATAGRLAADDEAIDLARADDRRHVRRDSTAALPSGPRAAMTFSPSGVLQHGGWAQGDNDLRTGRQIREIERLAGGRRFPEGLAVVVDERRFFGDWCLFGLGGEPAVREARVIAVGAAAVGFAAADEQIASSD